jgi:hypothetical protein
MRRPGFEPGSCGICGGQSGAGAGFLLVLRFPLPILIPPTAPQSSSVIRGWYNRPIVAAVPSGLSLTIPTQNNINKRETIKRNIVLCCVLYSESVKTLRNTRAVNHTVLLLNVLCVPVYLAAISYRSSTAS